MEEKFTLKFLPKAKSICYRCNNSTGEIFVRYEPQTKEYIEITPIQVCELNNKLKYGENNNCSVHGTVLFTKPDSENKVYCKICLSDASHTSFKNRHHPQADEFLYQIEYRLGEEDLYK